MTCHDTKMTRFPVILPTVTITCIHDDKNTLSIDAVSFRGQHHAIDAGLEAQPKICVRLRRMKDNFSICPFLSDNYSKCFIMVLVCIACAQAHVHLLSRASNPG